jgi:hypothetical protein
MVAAEAKAQIIGPTFIGPSIGGPTFGPGGNHAWLHSQLARREFQRQARHAAAHEQDLTDAEHARLHRRLNRQRARDLHRHDDFHFGTLPPVVFLPPATRASRDPFAGSPHGGNYFYWLSREYAKGRVSKEEYNRQVYGIGR